MSDYATPEEIETAIAALTKARNALLPQLKAARAAQPSGNFNDMTLADQELVSAVFRAEDERKDLFVIIKDLKAGQLPFKSWQRPELAEINQRQDAARKIAVQEAVAAKAATPIDDAAWERELHSREEWGEFGMKIIRTPLGAGTA